MHPFTTGCNRLSATYSYLAGGIKMTRLIHVLCACGLLQGSHGGAVLVDHSGHWSDPKTLFVFVLHKHKFVFVFVKELLCVPKTSVIGRHNGMRD